MRVTLAHDYLTQFGGAERVALGLTRIYPSSPLYTAVYEAQQTFPAFRQVDVRTSSLQRFGVFRKDPRRALPVLSRAWREFYVDDADAVLTSSSGWAHGLRTAPGIRKIVYCHNPPRWLYQGDDYLRATHERAAISVLGRSLRQRDLQAAASADTYIANSSVVAARIRSAYGIKPVVINPPVDVDVHGPGIAPSGIEPGFWLTVSRARSYKNTELVVDAVTRILGQRLVVVGGAGAPHGDPGSHNRLLHDLGRVSDEVLRWLYRNCRGIVTMAYEDFGLTPIEANAFGKPAITLRAGGFLDSVRPGVSGAFIDEVSAESAAQTLADLPAFDPVLITDHARRFSIDTFSRRIRSVMTYGVDLADVPTVRIPRRFSAEQVRPPAVPHSR